MRDRAVRQTIETPRAGSAQEEFAQLIGTRRPDDVWTVDGRIPEVRTGTLVGFAPETHMPLVTYLGQPCSEPLPARATLALHTVHVGREVALLFDGGDPRRPIVVGCLHQQASVAPRHSADPVEIDADGRRLVISASEQIVLRCGKASITLTKEGKIILQGAYVSSHSSGVLRLKGGSVNIN